MSTSPENQVSEANGRFYKAFEDRDMAAMEQLWDHGERVVCTHPGWPSLRGWTAVAESWRALLSGPQVLQFILTDEHVDVIGDAAWVSVDENLIDSGASGTVAAINVFARDADGDWRMVAHHGSSVVARR